MLLVEDVTYQLPAPASCCQASATVTDASTRTLSQKRTLCQKWTLSSLICLWHGILSQQWKSDVYKRKRRIRCWSDLMKESYEIISRTGTALPQTDQPRKKDTGLKQTLLQEAPEKPITGTNYLNSDRSERLVAKSTCCPCREPVSHSGSQLPASPVPGGQTALPGLRGHCIFSCTYSYKDVHIHK